MALPVDALRAAAPVDEANGGGLRRNGRGTDEAPEPRHEATQHPLEGSPWAVQAEPVRRA